MAKIVKKKNVSVRYYTKPKDYLYMALVQDVYKRQGKKEAKGERKAFLLQKGYLR